VVHLRLLQEAAVMRATVAEAVRLAHDAGVLMSNGLDIHVLKMRCGTALPIARIGLPIARIRLPLLLSPWADPPVACLCVVPFWLAMMRNFVRWRSAMMARAVRSALLCEWLRLLLHMLAHLLLTLPLQLKERRHQRWQRREWRR